MGGSNGDWDFREREDLGGGKGTDRYPETNLVTKALQTLAHVALTLWWKREGGLEGRKDNQRRLKTL